MLKFSVCTDAVFSGMDTSEAIRKCAALEILAAEFWNWQGKDMEKIIKTANECGVAISVFCA